MINKTNLTEMAAAPIPSGKFEEWVKKRTSRTIYLAGKKRMSNFNYDKALDVLIKRDYSSDNIAFAGRDWPSFDFEKGFKALVKKDKTGKWIYQASKDWYYFDYEKGLNELIKKDETGKWIYYIGKKWKNFDYNKGLDILIKKGKITGGEWIHNAGRYWKKFDYEKGLDALKNIDEYYYRMAKKEWPKNIKQSLEKSKQIKDTAKKLPMKKLKLEHLNEMAAAPIPPGKFEEWAKKRSNKVILQSGLDKYPNFDYKKAIKTIMRDTRWVSFEEIKIWAKWPGWNEQKVVDKLLDSEKKYWMSALDDDSFLSLKIDRKKFLKQIKDLIVDSDYDFFYKLVYPIETSEKRSKHIRDTSKKLPMKALKLEAKNFTDEQIYYNGKDNLGNFDYEKGLNDLIKADRTGEYIWRAGLTWEEFNFDKGLDGLIKVNEDGYYIYIAGKDWKQLDYKKALRSLRTEKDIYYYRKALRDWPKGIQQSQSISKKLGKTAKKLPMKTLKLEDVEENLRDARYIYYDGKEGKKFNFEKGLNDLIELDNSGEYIWRAGWIWKKFDFKKGLNVLVEKDKYGRWIYYAGNDWKNFDNKKGLKALRDISFYYYRKALKEWPKNIKQQQTKSRKIKRKAKKLPKKILKLENFIEEINNEIY